MTATLEQLETRAHLTMAESARARDSILRHPRSPRAIERAWRVVAGVRGLLAWAEPVHVESLIHAEQAVWIVAEMLQRTHVNTQTLLKLAAAKGLSGAPWFRALSEALEDMADSIEALYLSHDPEMRAAIEASVAELVAARAAQPDAPPPDWRAALAKMSG